MFGVPKQDQFFDIRKCIITKKAWFLVQTTHEYSIVIVPQLSIRCITYNHQNREQIQIVVL